MIIIQDEILSRCKDEMTALVDQYYLTVHLTLGLKDYFDAEKMGCRFVAAEKKLFSVNENNEVMPDILLQYNEDTKGIIGEIKSSVSLHNEHVIEKIFQQLNSYDQNIKGWDTVSEEVLNHDIISFIHTYDSDKYVTLIINSINNNALILSKNYCIIEFSSLQRSPKWGEGDVIIIKYKYGELDCENLKQKFIDNVQIRIDRLSLHYDRCKFVRSKPPMPYLMSQLWQLIFPYLTHGDPEAEDISVNINDILDVSLEYFSPWAGIPDEYSQLRISWIKDAMQEFINIKLAEKIDDDPLSYKIYIRKRALPKNMKDYIINSMCEKMIKERRIQKEGQTKLQQYNNV